MKKKIVFVFAFLLCIVLVTYTSAEMPRGWNQLNGIWFYYTDEGEKATGWQHINDIWYLFSEEGEMQTGWQQVGGIWYYFNTDGAMMTGWQTIGNKTYYFKASGAMAAGEWCDGYWLNEDGSWTYAYKASWQQNDTGRWYGDESGWYAKDCTLIIDDEPYTFNASGYLVPSDAITEDTIIGVWYANYDEDVLVFTFDQAHTYHTDYLDGTPFSTGSWGKDSDGFMLDEGLLRLKFDGDKIILGDDGLILQREPLEAPTLAILENAKETDYTGRWKVTGLYLGNSKKGIIPEDAENLLAEAEDAVNAYAVVEGSTLTLYNVLLSEDSYHAIFDNERHCLNLEREEELYNGCIMQLLADGTATIYSPDGLGIPQIILVPMPSEAESWTCENGHEGNTGKYCYECGSPKPLPEPEENTSWTCINGHKGNTGKFCYECGSPKPQAEDGSWTCVNGHEGNTGNYCYECGSPRP